VYVDHARTVRLALTDVVRVCSALGLLSGGPRSFQRQARGVTIRCPWHEERTPSCSVRVAGDGTIAAHCFGCDRGGDVLSLIAQVRGLELERDFREVLRIGAEFAGLWSVAGELAADDARRADVQASKRPAHVAADRHPDIQASGCPAAPLPQNSAPLPAGGDFAALSTADVSSFDRVASSLLDRAPLDAQSDVCGYLESRKMLDLARSAGWGALPARPAQSSLAMHVLRSAGDAPARASGLFPPDFRLAFTWEQHRLLIPYRTPDVEARVHTLQRRYIGPDDPKSKYVFPRERARPLYPYLVASDLETVDADAPVAFVEGAPDVLALRWLCAQEGFELLVLGIPGVKNWLPSWGAFARGRRAVYLALDADRAGDDAVAAVVRDLHGAKVLKRWRPKGGKDWAEYLAKVRA
jgi:DNA primase